MQILLRQQKLDITKNVIKLHDEKSLLLLVHLKENDKHIKILYEKNSICLTEDDEDELDDLLKK